MPAARHRPLPDARAARCPCGAWPRCATRADRERSAPRARARPRGASAATAAASMLSLALPRAAALLDREIDLPAVVRRETIGRIEDREGPRQRGLGFRELARREQGLAEHVQRGPVLVASRSHGCARE